MTDPQHELRDAHLIEVAGGEPAGGGVVLEDRYELQDELGRGGMGVVYRAWHRLLERPVAVKMLHAHLIADEQQLLQMRREARLIADLDHPHIVSVHAFGTTPEGSPYVVMELLQGRTLAAVLAADSPLPVERTVAIMLQVAQALEYSHEKGIIHRDLKPNNIVLIPAEDGGELAKLVDFGIARRDVQSHTVTQVVGTPPYMSPEQCLGKRGTAQADLYSLACVMHECISGRPPFCGESAIDTLRMHLSEAPPALKTLRADTPVALQNIVLKLLAKDPQARYQSAADLIEDLKALQKFLRGQGPEPVVVVPETLSRPSGGPLRRINPALVRVGLLILTLVIAAVAIFMHRSATQGTAQLDLQKYATATKANDTPDRSADPDVRAWHYLGRINEARARNLQLGALPQLLEGALDEMDRLPKGDRRVIAHGFANEMEAARIFAVSNDAGRAAFHADRAAHYAQHKPSTTRAEAYVTAMCSFAASCIAAGEIDKAMAALQEAEKAITGKPPYAEETQDFHNYNRLTAGKTLLALKTGKADEALKWAEATAGVDVPHHNSEHNALLLEALNKAGKFDQTLKRGEGMLAGPWDQNPARHLALRMMAQAASATGDDDAASRYLQQADTRRNSADMSFEEQRTRLDLADLLIKKRRYDQARIVLEDAQTLQRVAPALTVLPLDEVVVPDLTLEILRRLKRVYGFLDHPDNFKHYESQLAKLEAANQQQVHKELMPKSVFKLPPQEKH